MFRILVLRALLILLRDVQIRHWPGRAVPIGPQEVENVQHQIREYLETERRPEHG